MSRYEAYDAPHERLGGRSLNAVFASASAGCGPDQSTMAELALLAGETGNLELGGALLVAETWARQAMSQGYTPARAVMINILREKARLDFSEHRDRALASMAEALSYMDEFATEGYIDAGVDMERFLSGFVAERGGSEEERASIVSQAKELREWRAK